MVPSCVALISYLCVFVGGGAETGPQTTITITTTSLYRVAHVRSAQWRAVLVLSSDVAGPVYYDPTAVQEACNDGNCIKYHRRCDNAVRPKSCDYRFISPFLRSEIHVEADSEGAYAVAGRMLYLLAANSGGIVPFSTMSHEASVPYPYCQPTRGQQKEQACIEVIY